MAIRVKFVLYCSAAALLLTIVAVVFLYREKILNYVTVYQDEKRFLASKDEYESHSGAFSFRSGKKIQLYPWEEDGFAGQNFFTILIYDETRQILLNSDRWDPEFVSYIKSHDRTLIHPDCSHSVYNLRDDYFVVRIAC